MTRIELTPELIFERISDVGSPSSSSVSYNSRGQETEFIKSPNRRPADPQYTAVQSSTLPRQRHFELDRNTNMASRNFRNDLAVKQHGGYYSLGRDTRSTKHKNDPPTGSDYGVAISIKGIEGHPFVILEDKEKHRHMVPAPDPSESSDVSSENNRIPNGIELDGPAESVPRKADTLQNDWRNRRNPPDLIKPTYSKGYNTDAKPTNAGNRRVPEKSRSMPYSETLVKPSEIKATQKPSASSPSALHMRSPRARTTHERSRTLPGKRSDAATRSRSLSPNRALASKPNRSRSMSPPRKPRTRRVDDHNTQPVSSLIGFFEIEPQDDVKSGSSHSLDRRAGRQQRTPVAHPRSTDRSKSTSSLQRSRKEEAEIEVTPNSRKPNLTVATATARPKSGVAPAGRYFALTSPSATSPHSLHLNQKPHHLSPKLAPVKASLVSSPSSSETGISTDEGTLNLSGERPRINTRRSQEHGFNRPEPKRTDPHSWHTRGRPKSASSGVSEEPLMKPSTGSSIFGTSEKKGQKRVMPLHYKTKRSFSVGDHRQSRGSQKNAGSYLAIMSEQEPANELARKNWRSAASKALAHEEEIVPTLVKRDVEKRNQFAKDKRKTTSVFADFVDVMIQAAKDKPTEKRNLLQAPLARVSPKAPPIRSESSPASKDLPEEAPIVVSKAKVVGPSHQLLKKTRRKRNARRISTSNPGSRTASCSEWSESEYSEGESLNITVHSSADEEDKKPFRCSDTRSLPDITSPVSFTGSDTKSPKRIVFGKITSQDTTKAVDEVDAPVACEPLQKSSTPATVLELQQHIGELRETVHQLQRSANDNLQNYELLNELQSQLRDVEEEKKMLEREIGDGRRSLNDLERRLEKSQHEITELRRNERNDRVVKQQQTKELDDLKSELSDVSDALDKARSSPKSDSTEKSHLIEDLQHLRNEYDELLAKQEEREKQLIKREDELLLLRKGLREEADGHDEEVEMMRKVHGEVLSRLREELETLRKESMSAVEARPRLEDQISRLRNELNRLKENRRDVGSWNSSSSSSDDEGSSSAASRAREEAGRNKKLLLQTQQELKTSQAAAEDLKNELKFLQRKLNNGSRGLNGGFDEEQIRKLTASLDQVKENKKSLESEMAALELQRNTLRGQVKEARTEREDGDRAIRGLETEIARLKGKIQELENEVERLKKELLRSRRHLEAQVCDLEHQVNDSDKRISDLSSEKTKLEMELSEAKVITPQTLLTSMHGLEIQKANLQSALVEKRTMVVEREVEIESLHQKLRRMSSSAASSAANDSIQELEEFKKKSASEIDHFRSDVEAKARLLREADRTNVKLQEELRRMDLELEEELKEREATVAELSQVERNLHELEDKVVELNREKEDRLQEMDKLQGMLSLVEDDKLNLEEKLDNMEKEKMNASRDLHHIREDFKDKDIEIEELRFKIKNIQSEVDTERSKVSELEHHKYVTDMHVNGLKEALEAKYEEVGDAEAQLKKMAEQIEEEEQNKEETLKKLRAVEKQRRLAAKEAEDLTIALGEKVASLDEAQRKLRRLDAKLSDMDEANISASNMRFEVEKIKKNHSLELVEAMDETEDVRNALTTAEENVTALENELRLYEERYESAAGESLELEKLRRNLVHQLDEAKAETERKNITLSKAEEKLTQLETELATSEDEIEKLTNQLRHAERLRKEAEVKGHEATSCLEDKEQKLRKAESKIDSLQAKIEKASHSDDESKKALDDLEEAREEAKKEVDKMREEMEQFKQRWHEEEEKVSFLEDKLKFADEALKDEVRQSRDAEEEKRHLLGEIGQLRRELEERNGALVKAQAAIKNIEKKMLNYKENEDKKSMEFLQLSQNNDKANEKIDELKNKVKKEKNKSKDVKNALTNSQNEKLDSSTDEESEATRNRCEELEDELSRNHKEVAQLKENIQELKKEVDETTREKKEADENTIQLQKQVELLQLELKERGDWSDRKQDELQSEIQTLETELKSAEQELHEETKEKSALEAKIDHLEKDISEKRKAADGELKKEIGQLRNTLDEKTQQIFAAEDTIYRQKEVIEELTTIQKDAEESSLGQMDAYMLESDKQFEQLKSHLQEKADVIDTLQQEKEALLHEAESLSADLNKARSDADRVRSAYDKEQTRLEELEQLLKELRSRLKQEQKENSELREQVSANLRSQSQDVDSDDEAERSRLHAILEESKKELERSKEEKQLSFNKLEVLQDKFGQLNNEFEMERSQVELLKRDAHRQKQEIDSLKDELEERDGPNQDGDLVSSLREQIATLEEKLEQEANELNAINMHHQRTEKKLHEVLKKAESESIKANSEKEMLNMRIKSLKDQLQESENQVAAVEDDQRNLQEEIQEQNQVNYELKQVLDTLRHGTQASSSSGNLFTSV